MIGTLPTHCHEETRHTHVYVAWQVRVTVSGTGWRWRGRRVGAGSGGREGAPHSEHRFPALTVLKRKDVVNQCLEFDGEGGGGGGGGVGEGEQRTS